MSDEIEHKLIGVISNGVPVVASKYKSETLFRAIPELWTQLALESLTPPKTDK